MTANVAVVVMFRYEKSKISEFPKRRQTLCFVTGQLVSAGSDWLSLKLRDF
jgi:hypothetical protein